MIRSPSSPIYSVKNLRSIALSPKLKCYQNYQIWPWYNWVCQLTNRRSVQIALALIFKASALWADVFYKSKCPFVCPSVLLSVCVFTFEVPFNGLSAPTSRSWMSNIFRDSESLGKSNGKKWSQIWAFLFENCLKSPRKKKFFFFFTFFTFEVPFNGLFAPPSRSRMSNIFRDSESLGKSNGKKWSQIWTFLFKNSLKPLRKKSSSDTK